MRQKGAAVSVRSGLRTWCAVWLVMSMFAPGQPVQAQDPHQVVEQMNRDAMDAYNSLDINKAGSMLDEALRVGYGARVDPQLLARVHVNLGVVYIGGLGDQNSGLQTFTQAVCLDPNVQLDPLTSSPEIQNVFGVALQRARSGACPTGAPAGPPAAPPPPQVVAPPPAEAFLHQSPPEQQTQTPLPIYVEINPLAQARKIYLNYRGIGMKKWQRVAMYRYQNGFAYQLSCNDVWEPKISYYIEARDENDRVVGIAGTAGQPIEVPIVAQLRQAPPSLPGATAPISCAAKECPPGLAGCKPGGKAGIGEDCGDDASCQSGLECLDGECGLIGAGGTEVPAYDPATGGFEPVEEPERDDPSEFRPTFVNVGFTIGLAYVQAGMVADRPAPNNRVFVDGATGFAAESPEMVLMNGGQLFFPEPNTPYESQLSPWVPDADSADSMGALGGNCSADGIPSGPPTAPADPMTMPLPGTATDPMMAAAQQQQQLYPSRYCVRVQTPGFVVNPALRLAIGHFITTDISLAAILRFQFSAGEGDLPNLLIGARGEYMFTAPKAKGLMLSAFLGATFGEIQAQPATAGASGEGAPWVRSGLFGVHVGGNVRYRFTHNFGLIFAPEFDFQLPTVLINVDLTIGGEAAF